MGSGVVTSKIISSNGLPFDWKTIRSNDHPAVNLFSLEMSHQSDRLPMERPSDRMTVRSNDLKGRDTSLILKCYNQNFKAIIHKHIHPKRMSI
ncbi:hypothetical protein Hdeb2414_s0013g00414981 [Helianthus debilis subsp. tardiflorus]